MANEADKKYKKAKIQGKSYLTFMLLMLLLMIGINILVYVRDFYSGLIVSFGVLLFAIFIAVYFICKRKKAMREFIRFVAEFSSVENRLMDSFEFPLFLVDKDMRLIWGNKLFFELDEDLNRHYGKEVSEIFPELKEDTLPRQNEHVEFNI